MGFNFYSSYRLKRRGDKWHPSYYFQINGVKAVEKWMKEIGFTSHNQLTKWKVWKKFGFLPPYTNINERIALLNNIQ
jgi:nickel-dependent lactate racemase